MTDDERKELQELRLFKASVMEDTLEVAFRRLEMMMDMPYSLKSDGVMSVRAFRCVAECLLEIKKKL